jgi:5-methyltetrahydrofolate--homocysteine methyltransferase
MSKLKDQLKNKSVLVSDGAWGTFLFEKGLQAGASPEEWNLINRNAIFEIAKSYIDAGSDIISTNSFGGNRLKLSQYGLGDRTFEINKNAAIISREAAGNDKLVFGSIGPTGKFLITGEVTEAELFDSFEEQSSALIEGGVDTILLETFYDIEEAKIAIKSIKNISQIEIACSFTFDLQPDGSFKTLMGASPTDIVKELISMGVDIVGSNCGSGFENLTNIAKEIIEASNDIPLLVQANAGLPLYKDDKLIYSESPEFTVPFIKEMINAGVKIIGGCCGTTPDHIIMIRKLVDELAQVK